MHVPWHAYTSPLTPAHLPTFINFSAASYFSSTIFALSLIHNCGFSNTVFSQSCSALSPLRFHRCCSFLLITSLTDTPFSIRPQKHFC